MIGVHTPEFDFEHVASNVEAAVSRLGVKYPVAMDNNYGTWNAWGNNSWPAEYLIDPNGNVRYGSVGEGDYGTTEGAIRALLAANGAKLPPPTAVPDRTPDEASTPESYLGYERLARYNGTPIVKNQAGDLHLRLVAAEQPPDVLRSVDGAERGHRGRLGGGAADQRLRLRRLPGAVRDRHRDRQPSTASRCRPSTSPACRRSTRSLSAPHTEKGVVALSFSPGIKAYDFTFG